MAENFIDINLTDPNSEGMEILSNLLDPVNLSIFTERLKDPSTTKSIDDLVVDLMEGR